MKILHITPALPPVINGVGNHAYVLANAMDLVSNGSLNNLLLSTSALPIAFQAMGKDSPMQIHLSNSNSGPELFSVVSKVLPDAIILNYVGYGYAKRGAPFWILNVIRSLRKKFPHTKILTMFHELYAIKCEPWKSAFWLSPVQSYIVASIARLSDCWVTSSEKSASWLEKHAAGKPHALLPVFSNIGETSKYGANRLARVVIFGGPNLRLETYRKSEEKLFTWALENGLEIHDIGPKLLDGSLEAHLLKKGVKLHGALHAEQVSSFLKQTMFGLISYPLDCVAKSGAFAALCAHGVVPILLSEKFGEVDGLSSEKHYLPGIPTSNKPNILCGENSWNWYHKHNVLAHAQAYLNLLQS